MPEGQTGATCESLWKKMIGKPYSGKLNVRFDEGELEIELLATTPALYSTEVAKFHLSICSKNLENRISFSSSSSKEVVNSFVGNGLLKLSWLWCYFNPFSFSPNLFCSTSLLCSTYFMQVERMVEADQAESCRPSCLRSTTVLLPPQPFFAFTHSTE